jgi:hypothetical protein
MSHICFSEQVPLDLRVVPPAVPRGQSRWLRHLPLRRRGVSSTGQRDQHTVPALLNSLERRSALYRIPVLFGLLIGALISSSRYKPDLIWSDGDWEANSSYRLRMIYVMHLCVEFVSTVRSERFDRNRS